MVPGRSRFDVLSTRKSFEEGLDQSFNSLSSCPTCEGVRGVRSEFKSMRVGRLSQSRMTTGASRRQHRTPRPEEVARRYLAGLVDTIVVYKVDRLTRSLADFARIVESFETRA